jgi:Xaa-Pro aminopeptidase
MDKKQLDALLVTHLPNVRYVCGFTGSAGVLLITPRQSIFITDGRYTVQARAEVKGARVVIARGGPLQAVAQQLRSSTRAARRLNLGIEAEHMTVAARASLATHLPAGVRLRSTSGLVESQRSVKDKDELQAIRRAAELGCKLFSTIVNEIRPGMTEGHLAARLEYEARCAGAEGMSFPTIVAAGERSALPHARASQSRLPRRGFVVLDFGVILAGYCSDMTRSVHLGRPDQRERALYEAVREAQAAGVQAVGPGVASGDVDDAARSVLRKNKLGRFFTHSTGHGVGLEIHEAPRLAKRQREKLQAGMVVTVEPGAYIPRSGGVRIEDMVVVTESGRAVLTTASQELITL